MLIAADLAELGQTTIVARSTIAQVRQRIAQLRADTANRVTAANYDFQKRLKDIKDVEEEERQRRRDEKKRKRQERLDDEKLGRIGVIKRVKVEGADADKGKPVRGEAEVDVDAVQKDHDDMAAMMGFGGFGGKKR